MKMTTEIKWKYFKFDTTGADYSALIATDSKDEAIEIYYSEISDRDMESNADCKQISSPEAWRQVCGCDDAEGEISIEEKLEAFEGPGVILWPLA